MFLWSFNKLFGRYCVRMERGTGGFLAIKRDGRKMNEFRIFLSKIPI